MTGGAFGEVASAALIYLIPVVGAYLHATRTPSPARRGRLVLHERRVGI